MTPLHRLELLGVVRRRGRTARERTVVASVLRNVARRTIGHAGDATARPMTAQPLRTVRRDVASGLPHGVPGDLEGNEFDIN